MAKPQPEPLPQSVILGCNAFNCASKISNANWETKLNEQVNVNQGDSIGVKASFIDTRGTASGNIVITKDTEISLEYYFYWIHNFNACNLLGLNDNKPPPPDASDNLTQQVLVGRTIPYLYDNAVDICGNFLNIPVYYTNSDSSGNYSATSKNDADGLPYLLYQSNNSIPVAPVFGPVIPASDIVVGKQYVVNTQGLTTNWAYGGVPNASANVLPAGWGLNTSVFTATANPNGVDVPALSPLFTNPGMSPSEFLLPANVEPTLPYVSYMITDVGDTQWNVIDPTLPPPTIINAAAMVAGTVYTIVTIGDLDFTKYGAANNQIGTTFTCVLTLPPPPFLPIVLPDSFFADASNVEFRIDDNIYNFNADPTNTFSCTLNVNATNQLEIVSFAGSGGWCEDFSQQTMGGGVCLIIFDSIDIQFSAATTGIKNPLFELLFDSASKNATAIDVSNCVVGRSYTIDTVGGIDGSSPVFLWNSIGSFPTADTSNMVAGQTYQVVEDEGIQIPGAPNAGRLGDVFVSQGPVTGGSLIYSNVTAPIMPEIQSIIKVLLEGVTPAPLFDASINLIITPDSSGNCQILPNSSYISKPTNWLNNIQAVEITIGPAVPAGYPPLTALFAADADTNDFNDTTIINFRQDPFQGLTPYPDPPTPSKLILITPGLATNTFTCTGTYTGTGSTSTVIDNTWYLTQIQVNQGITIEGQYVYIPGSVSVGITPGTIIKSLVRDPAEPSTGLAVEYPTPNPYDGTVRDYTPATVKLDIFPVKKIWKMMLKAGSYDPNYLAELITRNMSRQKLKRVNNVKAGPFGTQSTLNVPTDSIWNYAKNVNINEWASPDGPGQNTFYDSKNPMVYDYPPQLDYNINPDNDDMPFIFVPSMNGSTLNNNQNPLDYIYAQVPHPNANGLNNLPSTKYNINLIPLINDVRSVSPTISNSVQTDGYYTVLPFYSQNCTTVANGIVNGNSGVFPIAYGATQTSLLYNNEGNGLFSFNYLHSPLLAFLSSATNDLTECTMHMYTTAQKSITMQPTNFFTTLVDKNSGVLLKDMQPRSFWNQLGFDVDALTVNLDDPNKIGFQMSLNEFNSKTTGGFCGSSNIFNQQFHTANSAMQPSVPDTELVFLTAIPNPPDVIDAYTGNLTVGTTYFIWALGAIADEDHSGTTNHDWLEVGGTYTAEVGNSFVATSTGFPNPPDEYSNWSSTPQVIITGSAVTTSTQLQNNYFQVQNTNTLNAGKIPTVRDQTGHYLIEITGYNGIYLDDKSKREIKSIVSSYFVTQGAFVSQVFPESYNYYHVGTPISLSNLKIRILDPYDMSEAQIGPNSSVYLQVNKMLSDIAVQQVEN